MSGWGALLGGGVPLGTPARQAGAQQRREPAQALRQRASVGDGEVGAEEGLVARPRRFEVAVAAERAAEAEEPATPAHRHRLDDGHLEQPLGTAGDAVAAAPPAAEGHPRVGRRHDDVVDGDDAGGEPRRHRPRRRLAAEHRGAEGPRAAVGAPHRLLDVIDGIEQDDRREEVGGAQLGIGRRLGDHQRQRRPAGGELDPRRRAAHQPAAAGHRRRHQLAGAAPLARRSPASPQRRRRTVARPPREEPSALPTRGPTRGPTPRPPTPPPPGPPPRRRRCADGPGRGAARCRWRRRGGAGRRRGPAPPAPGRRRRARSAGRCRTAPGSPARAAAPGGPAPRRRSSPSR